MPDEVKLPEYQCHKKVSALKIARVEDLKKAGGLLHFKDEAFAPRQVSEAYMELFRPEAGDYFVVNEIGTESCFPAALFEEGYTKVG